MSKFYRYEIRFSDNEPWSGIATAFNPDERRKMLRFLHSPKWYESNPDIESEAWFTEYGYNMYKDNMNEIIGSMGDYRTEQMMESMQVRVREADFLDNVACIGTVQCIRLLSVAERVANYFMDNKDIMPIYLKNNHGFIDAEQDVFLATSLDSSEITKELEFIIPEYNLSLREGFYRTSSASYLGFYVGTHPDALERAAS